MGIFDKIRNSLRRAKDALATASLARKTKRTIERAAQEIKEAHKDDKGPGLIDVASVYRKGRSRRRDIRKTQRHFRSTGRKLVLINRPGTIVEHKGMKCFVTNKGKFVPFATAEV